MPKKKNDPSQTIIPLKGAERVRRRPSVIFGSDGLDGCEHAFYEYLSNAINEAKAGYGDVITVTAYKDHSIEIDDRGRGVPMGWNEEEGQYNWFLIFNEIYVRSKFNEIEDGGYVYSLGTKGFGACVSQYASEFTEVWSYDGENVSHIHFSKGEADSEFTVRPLEEHERRTGTRILWKPDAEVFTDINITPDYFRKTLSREATANGIRFILNLESEDGTVTTEVFG